MPPDTVHSLTDHPDITTAVETSRALPGETAREIYIHILMIVAVEYAGAERALLIRLRDNNRLIKAEATAGRNTVELRLRHGVVPSTQLPGSVLDHVIRTQGIVVLDDAWAPNQFLADGYIQEKQARSVLCLPLVNQGRPYGVLYLENRRAPGVFTPPRVAVLKRLAQAAILPDDSDPDPDLRAAEEHTRQPGRELRLAIDTIPEMVWSARPDGHIDFLNQRWREYTGLTMEEGNDWGWSAAIHPDDLPGMESYWRTVLASGEQGEAEARLRLADGVYRWFLFRAVPSLDERGHVVKWYGTTTDIDDRKQAEEQLRRSEAYLAEAQKLSRVGSFSIRLESREFVCSEEILRIGGWEPGTKPSLEQALERVHPEDRPWVQAKLEKAMHDGSLLEYEHRLLFPDGSIRHVHTVGRTMRDASNALEFVGAVMDNTERKNFQDALRAAKARLEGILEIAEDAIISVDSEQRILLFNQGAEKAFGYMRAEVVGHPLDLLLPQRLANVHQRHFEEFARSSDVARTMGQRREVSGRRKDGSEFPAEASISKLVLGGELVFTVILRDITDRKRAEQRLVAQHTVTRVLAEAATLEEATPRILKAVCECLVWDVGELWRIDRAAEVLRCVEVWHKESIAAPQFVAAGRESTFTPGVGLPGRVWSSRKAVYIPDVVRDSNFSRGSIAAREGLHAAFAFPILLGSEVVGIMDFFSQEIRQPDPDLLDMMATIGSQIGQFIERKRAEDDLRRSETYLAEAQRLSLTGSFGWNASSGELFWSRETSCILGYEHGMKPTLEMVYQRVHPDDLALVRQTVDRAPRDGTDLDFAHRLLMPDGSVKHVRVVAQCLRDETDAIEFVGAVSDVTAAKEAEERIRRDEQELQQIVEAIPALILVLAPDGSPLYANEKLLEYTGLTLDDVHAGDFRERVFHPDDVERLQDERRKALARGVPFELEQRARRKDGQYRWFLTRFNPLRDEQGHVIRWYATGTDIEDRKQAEERIRNENLALREEIDKTSMFEEIVGASSVLRAVLARVAKVAPTDSTVLITGETGTGKELVARAIHRRSPRASRAFVSVNCAAVPPALIASELFGHEKGAFTGATQRRLGRFELAEGGTLFLDEIGELPSETQIALLRVLQEREFERVGGTQPIRADVRVIAAANRNLQTAISGGAFREDLFYRLNVFPIEMPPLRGRSEDIPLLVEYFIDRYARKAGKKFCGVNRKTLELLRAYPWPGNIRELQNVIERSVIVCETETFSVDESWLSQGTIQTRVAIQPLPEQLATMEKTLIEAALAATKGRVSGPLGAAAKLGLPPSTLDSKIRSLKIRKARFKTD